MSKVRINDLARELEVKSKSILDALTAVGVTEKKTHSSSIEEDEAEKVRGYQTRGTRSSGGGSRAASGEARQGFNLSHVSKPGDALKAILERKQAEAAARNAPPSRPAAVTVAPPPRSEAPAVAKPAPQPPAATASASTPQAAPAPRRIVPQPRQAAQIVTPAHQPAIATRPPV